MYSKRTLCLAFMLLVAPGDTHANQNLKIDSIDVNMKCDCKTITQLI